MLSVTEKSLRPSKGVEEKGLFFLRGGGSGAGQDSPLGGNGGLTEGTWLSKA